MIKICLILIINFICDELLWILYMATTNWLHNRVSVTLGGTKISFMKFHFCSIVKDAIVTATAPCPICWAVYFFVGCLFCNPSSNTWSSTCILLIKGIPASSHWCNLIWFDLIYYNHSAQLCSLWCNILFVMIYLTKSIPPHYDWYYFIYSIRSAWSPPRQFNPPHLDMTTLLW